MTPAERASLTTQTQTATMDRNGRAKYHIMRYTDHTKSAITQICAPVDTTYTIDTAPTSYGLSEFNCRRCDTIKDRYLPGFESLDTLIQVKNNLAKA